MTSDQKPTPDEVIASWENDSRDGMSYRLAAETLGKALREAISQRDEARSLVRAYVDPMDTHAEDEAALRACGVMPDYCESEGEK